MYSNEVANGIKTGKELEAYFRENLVVNDRVRGPGGFTFTIVGAYGGYFWAVKEGDEVPATLSVHQMDSLKGQKT